MTFCETAVVVYGLVVFHSRLAYLSIGIFQGCCDDGPAVPGDDALQFCRHAVEHLRGHYGVFVCKADGECLLTAQIVIDDSILYGLDGVVAVQIGTIGDVSSSHLLTCNVAGEVFRFEHLRIDLHVVDALIGAAHEIPDVGLDYVQSDTEFYLLVLIAQFGIGGIFLGYDQPHHDGCQSGDNRSKDIGMPFQMLRYL